MPITYLLSVLISHYRQQVFIRACKIHKILKHYSLTPHRKSMPVSDMEKEIIDNLTADPKLLFASHMITGESPLIFLG